MQESFSTSLPTLVIFSFFSYCQPTGVTSHGFWLVFPDCSSFMCVLVICVSYLEKYLLKAFANSVIGFSFCCWVLHIFRILAFYQICNLQFLFFKFCVILSILMVSFDVQKFLILMKSHLSFSFVACASGVIFKNHCQIQGHEELALFFPKFYSVSCY